MGWAYWEFKKFKDLTTTAGLSSEGFYEDDGTLQVNKVRALSRTYLKATQGQLKSMKFEADNGGKFSATFVLDKTIQAPSVLYRNEKIYYPYGYVVKVVDEKGAELAKEQVVVNVAYPDIEIQVVDDMLDGKLVGINIEPKVKPTFLVE